jgi:hypothetical protein
VTGKKSPKTSIRPDKTASRKLKYQDAKRKYEKSNSPSEALRSRRGYFSSLLGGWIALKMLAALMRR